MNDDPHEFLFGPPDDPDDVPRSVHIVRMIRRTKFWRDARQFLLIVSGLAGAIMAVGAAFQTVLERF